MSSGSSLSGITFSGLGSGIDTDSIVSRLIQVESIPLQRLKAQQAILQGKTAVFAQFRANLRNFATAASALNTATAYNPIKAASSDQTVATVSATSTAAAGAYNLSVSKLAQTHKLSSAAQSSASQALNLNPGKFSINGKVIDVVASDTLTSIATKINSANAGVVAGIIDGGTGQAYLSITASKSGKSAAIALGDVGSGTVLSALGIVGGSVSVREPLTPTGAASVSFSSKTAALESIMGSSGLGSGNVTIGSGSISIDFATDSLDSIAAKINNPINGTGATATVKATAVNGVTTYRLEVTGTNTFGNESNILQTLGVLQQAPSHVIVNAQDAAFTLDGVSLTSASNNVTDVIPGISFTLLKADLTTPPTTTFTLTRDNEQVKKSMQNFVDAFNSMVDFIKSASQFDKESFESGPLFGDPVAEQVENTVGNLLFNNVPGLTGAYKNLTQLGMSFDDKGKLTLDAAVLETAINTDADAVGKVLRTAGSSTSAELNYVSSTAKTLSAPSAGYTVHITQPATKASLLSRPGLDGTNATPETLTFGGALFGSTDYQLVIPPNSSLASVIAQINVDPRLRDLVVASDDGGVLRLTSKKFGTPGDFTVKSDQDASSSNSGIGTDDPGVRYAAAKNVAGTINGEAATGSGQFLTGNVGNPTTDGLQIQYTGNATDLDVGQLFFSKGIAAQANDLINSYTDTVNGLLTANDQSIQAQIDDMTTSIASMQERLERRQEELKARFTAMEQAITRIRSQANQLGAISAAR